MPLSPAALLGTEEEAGISDGSLWLTAALWLHLHTCQMGTKEPSKAGGVKEIVDGKVRDRGRDRVSGPEPADPRGPVAPCVLGGR